MLLLDVLGWPTMKHVSACISSPASAAFAPHDLKKLAKAAIGKRLNKPLDLLPRCYQGMFLAHAPISSQRLRPGETPFRRLPASSIPLPGLLSDAADALYELRSSGPSLALSLLSGADAPWLLVRSLCRGSRHQTTQELFLQTSKRIVHVNSFYKQGKNKGLAPCVVITARAPRQLPARPRIPADDRTFQLAGHGYIHE